MQQHAVAAAQGGRLLDQLEGVVVAQGGHQLDGGGQLGELRGGERGREISTVTQDGEV